VIWVDTNVFARYLLNDDPAQGKAATALLKQGTITAAPTVFLELVWVLESYDCSRAEIAKGLRHLLGLPNLKLRDFAAVLRAVQWYEAGLDFADAMHVALSDGQGPMYTFDRNLIKRAGKLGTFPAVAAVPSR
jgi:predicted nucleic-acid-binding protein